MKIRYLATNPGGRGFVQHLSLILVQSFDERRITQICSLRTDYPSARSGQFRFEKKMEDHLAVAKPNSFVQSLRAQI